MTYRKEKIARIASWVSIIFIISVSVTILIMLFYPYPTPSIKEPIPILNDNKEIKVGGTIIQELEIHKPNNNPPLNVSRSILCDSGRLITLETLTANNLPVGEFTIKNEAYTVPKQVEPGDKCVFIWRQSYKVNPIRYIQAEWRSEKFKIIE
jgi:hypothetical protein